MKYQFIKQEIKYDGSQLSSHFAYKNFGLSGDSIIAFIGPVNVSLSKMVDIEDVIRKEPITSDQMLNFIIEVFHLELNGTIWMQRLLMAIIQEEINNRLKSHSIKRNGDDLYFDNRKLSVSIATASPVSCMVHAAINTALSGAPIPIASLSEFSIKPEDFGETIIKRFSEEFEDVGHARVKVNWVE